MYKNFGRKAVALVVSLGIFSHLHAAETEDENLIALQQQWESLSESKGNEALATALNTETVNQPLIEWLLTQDADRVEELANDGVEDFPQSAQLWYLRGRIHANQAMNSVFSALSHAKKSLKSFEQAAQLQPQELTYLRGVFSFYQGAPSMAGGSTEKAIDVAKSMIAIDARKGYQSLVSLGFNKSLPEVQTWIDEAQAQLGELPEYPYMQGMMLQQEERFAEAAVLLSQAVANEQTDEDSQSFKLKALYQIGRTSVLAEQYSLAAQQSLEQYIEAEPAGQDMPSMSWATLRLAQLHAYNNQSEQAVSLLASIDTQDDERLEDEIKKLKRKL